MRKDSKTEFARRLRKTQTPAETLLWFHLRRRQLDGHRFRNQHPLGPYVADFACIEARLVVEIDGSQHGSSKDEVRDHWMRDNGFRVLRFWNHDVLYRTSQVLAAITDVLLDALPPSGLRPPSSVARGQEKHRIMK